MEIVSVGQLVMPPTLIENCVSFWMNCIYKSVKMLTSNVGAHGFGKERLVICLILQVMEDLSYREFERFIAENNAPKGFRDFTLLEQTPDYTIIYNLRNSIVIKQMADLFNEVKGQMQRQNCCGDFFTFVDAMALISNLHLWVAKSTEFNKTFLVAKN